METFYRTHKYLVEHVYSPVRRALLDEINWSSRLIGIKGSRGVGKTTFLLQYALEKYGPDDRRCLYINMNHFYFYTHSLREFVSNFQQQGGRTLLIDEIFKYPGWSEELKFIHDQYPKIQIIFAGSTVMRLKEANPVLNGIVDSYNLRGFSFREYLLFKGYFHHEAVDLEHVLSNHISLAMEITSEIKPLMLFNEYLRRGYYPFVLEAKQDYLHRLEELMLLIIYQDIPRVDETITLPTLQKAQKLLMILATQVPLEPNISTLCREIGATRDVVIRLLYLMEKAGLLMLVNKESNSYKTLSRPDKIYLNNTNQMYALTGNVNEGTLRETFFVNQLRQAHNVLLPVKGDYLIDDKYTFEVGGASKTFKQIKNIPNSYLALDEVEFGTGNTIPLYLLGFLY